MADLSSVVNSADVIFFDSPGCPYCSRAESALKQAGIPFKKVTLSPYRDQLRQSTGKTSAPSVWIKGRYVGGCNDGTQSWHGVLPLLRSKQFQKMLDEPKGQQQPSINVDSTSSSYVSWCVVS